MTVEELVTKWGFQIDDKKLNDVDKKIGGIKNRLNLLVAVELGTKLVGLVRKFDDFYSALDTTSKNMGIAVEQYQKLSFAARQNSVSQEELGGSLTKLSKTLYSARKDGGSALESFKQLGIGQDQVKSFKTADQALFAISDRLNKIQDPIKKTALAQELLGKNSKNMVPWLSQGSDAIRKQTAEAERLGIVLSGDQINALKRAGDALKRLFDMFTAFAAKTAAYFAPLIEFITNDFIELLLVIQKITATNLEDFFYSVGYALGALYEVFRIVVFQAAKFFNLMMEHKEVTKWILGTVLAVVAFIKVWQGLTFLVQAGIKVWGIFQAVISTVKTMLFLLRAAWLAVAAGEWAALAPILAIIAAVGVLVVVIHDLWAMFTGGKTWTGSLVDWVKKGIGNVTDMFAGAGGAGAKMSSISGPNGVMSSVTNNANKTSNGGNSYTIDAPMNFTIPPGTDPKDVGNKAYDAIQSHLEKMSREFERSTPQTVRY